ncbi:unnamed protein product [Cladocopium goreaui]|uniref:RNase H type-1 domain-containing protein n=1 Tax=Cladocopium goreaui TaxID=2562237 RepID=A0A9P1CZ50_9DINO|nr:unnamed protein product [Cladocopium goreaui]
MFPARLSPEAEDTIEHQIAQAMGISPDEVLASHNVLARPEDLVSQNLLCILPQLQDERRPSPFLRLVLVDLEIYEPNEILPGAFRRFSKWLPRTINRRSVFRMLDLESLLDIHGEHCRLWFNNNLIGDDFIEPLHLEDGNYLRILIGDQVSDFQCNDSSAESTDHMIGLQLPSDVATRDFELAMPTDADLCEILVGSILQAQDQPLRLHDGLGLRVQLRSRSETELTNFVSRLRAEEDTDDIQLWTHHWHVQVPATSPNPLHLQVHELERCLVTSGRLLDEDGTTPPLIPLATPDDNTEEAPAIDRFPDHQGDILDSWRMASTSTPAIDTIDGELHVKFVTWFLNGDLWPRCDAFRIVALPADPERWDAIFRRTWRDRADPSAQLQTALVYPPVTPDHHGGHLIIHQNLGPTVRGTLLSVFWHGQESELGSRFAQVVPHWLSFQRFLQFADLLDACRRRILLCVGFSGSHPIDDDRPLFPRHGTHVEIHAAEWQVIDENSLMQQPGVPPLAPTGAHFAPPQAAACDAAQLNADAPIFVPGVPWEIGSMSEFTQDLHALWQDAAFSWEDESPSCPILVWFVDHQWHAPHGRTARIVHLHDDFHTWEDRIRRTWADHIVEGRSGYSIVLQLRPRPHPRPTETAVNRSNRAPVLLQLSHLLHHDVLSQEEIVEDPALSLSSTSINVAIRLRSGSDNIIVPEYIECSAPGASHDIEAELKHWGIECKAIRFGPRHEALCLPVQWTAQAGQFHYMFCHDDPKDNEGTFLHTSDTALDDLGLMQLLHKFGYCRAAILETKEPMPQLFMVLFLDVVQRHAVEPLKQKFPAPWPTPLVREREHRPFFSDQDPTAGDDDFLIRLGITMTDIQAFFRSGDDMLCRDPNGLAVPETTMRVLRISDTTDLATFDRIIIYTDGSSLPLHRHRPAAWNEENGIGDTWAFVVLGERYLEQQPTIEIIGWLAHPVRYDPSCPSFVGAKYVGSLCAEREAMTWAAIWRLSQNIDTPTLFRSDSWTTAMQALGQIGTAHVDTSFASLRSCFQALDAALRDRVKVEHTPGHCGDPYNDFADWLAKEERIRSFYYKRQAISMDLWRPFLPYMWMLFSQTDGLPALSAKGLHVPPPQLPSLHATSAPIESKLSLEQCAQINIRPGTADSTSVFNTIGCTTSGTPLLRAFLDDRALCLPCTSACHEGTHTTWVTPDGLSEHMIDYIAIPSTCLHECLLSKVLDEFDLGNSHHDHMAIALQLQWQETGMQTPVGQRQAKAHIDFSMLQSHHVMQTLNDYVVPAWSENIEDQVSHFNGHLLEGLQHRCPATKHRPKKPCLDDATWALRTQKLIARRGLRQIARRNRQEFLRACFQSWASTPDFDSTRLWQYHRWLLCANIKLMARFHTSAAHLKKTLRDRKTTYLKQAFENLPPDAPASSILQALKKVVGSTNLKQIKQLTLPMVKDSSGSHCTSPSQALDTWIQFFQNMEGGKRVDRLEQRHLWVQNLQKFQATSLDLQITDVPTLVELEMAFRHVKPNKATGPDLIDANICANSPAIVARKTYSQLLKLYTHGQESLLHKGGRLQPIWKQKGPRDVCSAYRSVLISSHVGKSLHRCLRLHTANVFEHYLQLQQTGGMRGISVTLGVHQARSYLRTRLRQHKCVGFLFLDLTEAFYRIVRQLALGGPPDDEAIAAVGERLHLGPGLLHSLHQHLEDQPAVEQAGPTWMDDTCIAFATESASALEQVTACRHVLQANRHRWQPMPGAGSQLNATMEAAHDGLLPPLKVQGPLLEQPHGRADEDFDQDLLEKIFLDIVDATTIAECERLIRAAARAKALSWSLFQATLERFLEIFTDEDAAVLQVPGEEIRQLLRTLKLPQVSLEP